MSARMYSKPKATRKTSQLLIICEGEKREVEYFLQYEKHQGRVRVEVLAPIKEQENHSPAGLLSYVKGKKAKMNIEQNDSVWFVFDTDDWDCIADVRQGIEAQGWHTAQSNPCFEVWLMYHHVDTIPNDAPLTSTEWKIYLHDHKKGDVDESDRATRSLAKERAEAAFLSNKDGTPDMYSTEVFMLMNDLISYGL